MRFRTWLSVVVTLLLAMPASTSAFCGFYVAGADAALYNDATQVVLMRSGRRTVLSMQNNYQGPAADFAMVVPVPVVLKEKDVKPLDGAIFKRVNALSAPRLVVWSVSLLTATVACRSRRNRRRKQQENRQRYAFLNLERGAQPQSSGTIGR